MTKRMDIPIKVRITSKVTKRECVLAVNQVDYNRDGDIIWIAGVARGGRREWFGRNIGDLAAISSMTILQTLNCVLL